MSQSRQPGAAGAARRDELLEVALEVLRTQGPHALSLRRVTQRAGTSTQAVYTVFGGKAGLVDALFAEGFRRLDAAFAALPTDVSPQVRLQLLAAAYRRTALDEPALYDLMFGRPIAEFEPTAASQELAWSTFAPLVDAVGHATGGAEASDEDVTRTATLLWASLHGVVSLELAGLVDDGESLVSDGLARILASLPPREPSSRTG